LFDLFLRFATLLFPQLLLSLLQPIFGKLAFPKLEFFLTDEFLIYVANKFIECPENLEVIVLFLIQFLINLLNILLYGMNILIAYFSFFLFYFVPYELNMTKLT